jgi:hypothetical protein
MGSRLLRSAAAVLLVLVGSEPLEAQFSLSARSMGMGGAQMSAARGEESLFQNPAHLALPGTPIWSIAVPQVTLGATLAGVRLGDFPTFTRLNRIPEGDKERIFEAIPDEGLETRFGIRAPLASIQIKRLAFGVSLNVAGDHSFSKDLLELALYGYEEGRDDYRAGNTAGTRMSYWDFAVAYGHRVGPVSLGATAHYLRGRTRLRSWMPEPKIDLEADEVEVDYVSVYTQGGNGFTLDLGAAYQPHPTVTLSVAAANLLHGMRWSDDLRVRHARLHREDLDFPDHWEFLTQHNISARRVGPGDAELTRGMTAADLRDVGNIPAELRLGAGWRAPTGTQVGASFRRALSGEALPYSWDRLLGIGVQQRLLGANLAARVGYATDLDQGSMVSAGALLGALEIGVARLSNGDFHGADREGWVVAAGLVMSVPRMRP